MEAGYVCIIHVTKYRYKYNYLGRCIKTLYTSGPWTSSARWFMNREIVRKLKIVTEIGCIV